MLTFYGSHASGSIQADLNSDLPDTVNWIDAFDPTAEEVAFVRRAMNARIPTLADLLEIETSSRLSAEGSTLFMSLPAIAKDSDGYPQSTPIGFVVNRNRLATIRYARMSSFEHLVHQTCGRGNLASGGIGATVSLLEILTDQLADVLEHVAADLDTMSRQIFTQGLVDEKRRQPRSANATLSRMLRSVGGNGDLISKVSDSLLSLSRMIPFLGSRGQELMTADFKARLEIVNSDAKSLRDFQDHLSNKVQFLLDTLLGLANIEQNNVFRVLTIVSVIGIPPTFFASMYGMNFKNMPELNWSYGYAFGLGVIFLSGLGPAIWFKVKGWW